MTQAELAESCETSQATISRVEAGDFEPAWPLRGRLAKVLVLPELLAT